MADTDPPPCPRCAAAARDAGLERARRAAAERRAAHAGDVRQMRESVLATALLAAPPAGAGARIADLQARLEAEQARGDAGVRALAAADQALEAAVQAHTATRAALDRIEATWWYRLFHRRAGE